MISVKDTEDLLTVREAAKLLRVHPGSIHRYFATGKLTRRKIAGHVLIQRKEILQELGLLETPKPASQD